ncbi:MAG TPA: hypothetical protein VMW16_09740 [Sedimentisphaerales bacterium]|nr:hypothetical protein [Sedimentisphaerales bacterium]
MSDQVYQADKLERITKRWWFFLLFVLLQFAAPPYASKGYKFPDEWGLIISQALSRAVIYSYPGLFPLFKIIPIILLIGIIIFHNKLRRVFSIYVAFSYLLFAFGQGIAITERYGVAVCTITVIMFSIVAAFWLWEAAVARNDFTRRKLPVWRYWVVPPALLAFWYPLNWRTFQPDFNPLYLFTNVAGVTFCMMTPVYVGLLTLYWPKVNTPTLRVTSLVGLIVGCYNMSSNFIMRPGQLWWNGVLHLPLLAISVYGLILSLKRNRTWSNQKI